MLVIPSGIPGAAGFVSFSRLTGDLSGLALGLNAPVTAVAVLVLLTWPGYPIPPGRTFEVLKRDRGLGREPCF
ncbi:MAG: hypothetical protein R3337_05530 [Gammaproteobacteria bacterium]|nr:hypothetical protein [Gammaproteobacteria bacterium]